MIQISTALGRIGQSTPPELIQNKTRDSLFDPCGAGQKIQTPSHTRARGRKQTLKTPRGETRTKIAAKSAAHTSGSSPSAATRQHARHSRAALPQVATRARHLGEQSPPKSAAHHREQRQRCPTPQHAHDSRASEYQAAVLRKWAVAPATDSRAKGDTPT